ncbi:RagB/SusD family nutrient uptake outer membrane protein [Leeuwenhoekiella sp. H156]|uniref:RagB/SusD family nutrient uptake outer membrane protein n=1 Tax=Leeuwenhoekiella sp. H156 TaxID=3450128 RepID=UPI003FA40D06
MKFIFKHLYILLLSVVFTTTVTSCSDEFLEIIPKGRLIAEKVVDYDKMFYNLNLVNMRSTNAQVPMGAELVAFEPYFTATDLRTQRLYKWEGRIYEDEQNAAELENTMENLYIYNKIINEVMSATEGSEQEKASLRAEALAGRAWVYFMVTNYYGLPYNEETSDTDLGFPIVLEADLVANNFTRATVEENYELMVSDLTQAIPNLPVQVESRFRFSRAAGKALLGKVYTFMGKFEEARPMLEQALSEMNNIGIEAGLLDYNKGYRSQRVDTDPESLYGKQIINNWANTSNELVVRSEVMDLYEESDLRLKALYVKTSRGNNAVYPVEGVYRKQIGSGQTFYGVRVPELYLLLAEVRARLNDLNTATSLLEDFRAHRMPITEAGVPATTASNREALLRYIFDERLREFAALGYHWFDMRRLTVDADLPTPVSEYSHILYNAEGTVLEEYTLTQDRLVLRFPQTVIDQNPNLINNN